MPIVNKSLNISIRKVLLARRKELEYSQEYLAEICGLHRNYIGNIERGEYSPTLDVFVSVCSALDLKPSSLLEESGF